MKSSTEASSIGNIEYTMTIYNAHHADIQVSIDREKKGGLHAMTIQQLEHCSAKYH